MGATRVTSPLHDSQLTEQVSAYSLGTSYAVLPAAVVDATKRVILDTLGCIVLGSTIPSGRIMSGYVRDNGGTGEATVVGAGFKAPAAYAALANGTQSHADELDSSHISWGHPASVAIPTGLAICESRGLGGQDLINTVVLSHDIGARLLKAVGGRRPLLDRHHSHSTVMFGVGAAAAAGRALELDQQQHQFALALAMFNISSPAAFMDERHHMSKAMTHGQAAFAGVSGALLAARGFEANEAVIEAAHGLVELWGTDATDISEITARLGEYYSVTDTGFKYYSAGYPIHAPLWGSLKILRDNDLDPGDVAAVRVGMSSQGAEVVDNREMPSICLQDMVSLGMTLGRLGYEDAHDHDALARPEVQTLRGKITIVRDPVIEAERPTGRSAWVEIDTTDGRTFRVPEQKAPGHWELGGMPWDDVEAKFDSLVTPRLGADVTAKVVAVVRDLESAASLDELTALLSGPSVGDSPA
jgi:2-methylcitrate dehydratase PrpD